MVIVHHQFSSDFSADASTSARSALTRRKTWSPSSSAHVHLATGLASMIHLLQHEIPPTLSSLPTELLVEILARVGWSSERGWKDLLRCAMVCRRWNTLIHKDSSLLRYIIELGTDGLFDTEGFNSRISYNAKLQQLLARRTAWMHLNWSARHTVPTPGECQAYELVGGVFAKVMAGDTAGGGGVAPHAPGDVDVGGARHLMVCSLPSSNTFSRTNTNNTTNETDADQQLRDADALIRPDIGVACRDFAIDPTQDLIVLVEQPQVVAASPSPWSIVVHLRSISSNTPHRLAIPPTKGVKPGPHSANSLGHGILSHPLEHAFVGSAIQIVGDVIAVFFFVLNVPRVIVWDWKTGDLLLYQDDIDKMRNVEDFSLLSERSFMFTTQAPGTIKIYSFSTDSTSSSKSGSTSLSQPTSTSALGAPTPLARIISQTALLLPPLASPYTYADITAHSAPYTAEPPTQGNSFLGKGKTEENRAGSGTEKGGRYFWTSEDSRVWVFGVQIRAMSLPDVGAGAGAGAAAEGGEGAGAGAAPGGGGLALPQIPAHVEQPDNAPTAFTFVLKGKVLTKYAKDGEKWYKGEEVAVPWCRWGPKNTRWFAERHRHSWLRYVHGSRFIRARPLEWPSIKCRMQVLDFNVYPNRPQSLSSSKSSSSSTSHKHTWQDSRRMSIPSPSPSSSSSTHPQPCSHPGCASTHVKHFSASFMNYPSVFLTPLVSCLPYIETTRLDEFSYSGFMIDEERIVGLSATAFANGDMRQIDVFTF